MKSTQIKLIHTSTAPDMSVPMIQYNLYSKKKYENTTNKISTTDHTNIKQYQNHLLLRTNIL